MHVDSAVQQATVVAPTALTANMSTATGASADSAGLPAMGVARIALTASTSIKQISEKPNNNNKESLCVNL